MQLTLWIALWSFGIPLLFTCLSVQLVDGQLVNYMIVNVLSVILVILCCYSGRSFNAQVAWRSWLLGSTCSMGIYALINAVAWRSFALYMCVLSCFHWSEFMTIGLCNFRTLEIDSFVLNHSFAYAIAAVSSWIEYWLEYSLWPESKQVFWIVLLGFGGCLFGDVLRKVAMLTAQQSFTHYVRYSKPDDHVLVTWGVYALFRHPSYVGWFYWSIFTQVLLANPLCLVLYMIASWKFFAARIPEEESTLCAFFGQQYEDYQRKVSTGLPFINGFM